MPTVARLVLSVFAAASAESQATTRPALHADVDPRVELMCILFRLAGNPEYNHPSSTSPYADDVEAHFGPFRNHPVIATAQRLRASRGVGYDAVMSMAVHLEDAASLELKIPFNAKPVRLDSRWRPAEARQFLAQARHFSDTTDFQGFFARHETLYRVAAERMTDRVQESAYRQWFDGFFGPRADTTFRVIVGLLAGPGGYGVSVRYPDGREDMTPVLGVTRWDAEGLPVIGDVAGWLAHEFCHPYTNPLVQAYADQLETAAQRLYAPRADQLRRQKYGTWQTMMCESLVRACVVRFVHATQGEAAAYSEAVRQHGRGFEWTQDLSERLAEYEVDRERYPTFNTFMPRIVAFFNEYAGHYAAVIRQAPSVVATLPVSGALDVDPGLQEIRVTFDGDMSRDSHSFVGEGPTFPTRRGELIWLDARTCVLPVTLRPGHGYWLSINGGEHQEFKAVDGTPAIAYPLSFRTTRETPANGKRNRE
ncbi:MAG: DUF4932 domain-containing protein [Phycisphaerae bacterium]|nr:DUF4932 domain-containing protein [Phycisphaerae bacterium]